MHLQLFLAFQIGVLQWFAKLWEIDTEDFWGYITNCGTEGNLHGILVGRENHPDGMPSTCLLASCSVFRLPSIHACLLALCNVCSLYVCIQCMPGPQLAL